MPTAPGVSYQLVVYSDIPDSKDHGANMGYIWDRQDPGGPYVGHMNFVIWASIQYKDGILPVEEIPLWR